MLQNDYENPLIKISGMSAQETRELLPQGVCLLGYVGSVAHGTHVPNDDPNSVDDKDIMGICVAPVNVYLGLHRFEQKESKRGEWDIVVYEIRKFFRLLLKQNPNVLSLLWLRENNYIYKNEIGDAILENRNLFTSKEAYHSFVGYAHGQLHRMTHMAYQGYMGAKRKALVDKHGYDTKNAAHLVRLLRMGVEYLTDGTLRVFREDAQELKAIKRGEWSLERVQHYADEMFRLAEKAFVNSPLPAKPNLEEAEALLINLLSSCVPFIPML